MPPVKINVSNEKFKGWDCIKVTTNQMTMRLLSELGGRIISLEFDNTELLFVQDEYAGEIFDIQESTPADWRKSHKLRLWGGDKTWLAPQSLWPQNRPWTDLDTAKYTMEINNNEFIMTSPVCRESGVELVRKINILKPNELELTETITNKCSPKTNASFPFACWNVSQIPRPVQVYIPQNIEKIVPYAHEGDSVALASDVLKKYQRNWSTILCRNFAHFKYGARLNKGKVYSHHATRALDQCIRWERNFAISPNKYLHDVHIEVYNSAEMNYLEIEVHSPYKDLKINQSNSFRQHWILTSIPDINTGSVG